MGITVLLEVTRLGYLIDLDVRLSSHNDGNYENFDVEESIGNYLVGNANDAIANWKKDPKTLEIQNGLKQRVGIPVLIKEELQKSIGDIGQDKPMGAVTRTSETCSDCIWWERRVRLHPGEYSGFE